MSLFKPKEVLILNTERKTLPFRSQGLFQDVQVDSYSKESKDMKPGNFLYYLNALMMNRQNSGWKQPENDLCANGELVDYSKIKLIVIDTLSQMFELMLAYHKKNFTGKDLRQVYVLFQDDVKEFWIKSSKFPIPKVFMSHPAAIQDELGIVENRAFIPGKAMEGRVEKEFTIVLATTPDRYAKDSKSRYRFQTNSLNGFCAKTPMGMFEDSELHIPNDLNFVVNRIYGYYGKTVGEAGFRFPDILIVGHSGTGKSTSLHTLITPQESQPAKTIKNN